MTKTMLAALLVSQEHMIRETSAMIDHLVATHGLHALGEDESMALAYYVATRHEAIAAQRETATRFLAEIRPTP